MDNDVSWEERMAAKAFVRELAAQRRADDERRRKMLAEAGRHAEHHLHINPVTAMVSCSCDPEVRYPISGPCCYVWTDDTNAFLDAQRCEICGQRRVVLDTYCDISDVARVRGEIDD